MGRMGFGLYAPLVHGGRYMEHINRLLLKARKAACSDGYPYAVGFVDYDESTCKYIACPQLWDGVKGSGHRIKPNMPEWWSGEHASEDEAVEALNRLFNHFNVPDDSSVIICGDYALED